MARKAQTGAVCKLPINKPDFGQCPAGRPAGQAQKKACAKRGEYEIYKDCARNPIVAAVKNGCGIVRVSAIPSGTTARPFGGLRKCRRQGGFAGEWLAERVRS
ncbi:MAG: hypothetical protein DBX55_00515 [Verrucomicrobia bacterium]|nr:MAG: hypothetical protein DBX55_00515 [Verrucomicrobiota bacterium]